MDERDVKQHHCILSFDPKDAECGLTPEKRRYSAWSPLKNISPGINVWSPSTVTGITEVTQFTVTSASAQKHFAGHQCVVAIHGDGHNGSHAIHCHISFKSLRIKDISKPEYSELM